MNAFLYLLKRAVDPDSAYAIQKNTAISAWGQAMTIKDNSPGNAAALRRQAEEIFRGKAVLSSENPETLPPEETRRISHELRVHQIELEIQNEELLRAQSELEAARMRYFDLYDLAPVGYCTLSEKGLILEANLTAATLLGTARSELARQPITRFILKEDQDIYYLHRKQLFETGALQECDLRMVTNDGIHFWAHLTATAGRDANSNFMSRVVINDITEQKLAEEALKKSEERHRTILQTAMDGFWIADMQGHILDVNDAYCRMSGYSIVELLAMSISDLEAVEPSAAVAAHMKKIEAQGEDRFETCHRRKDGSILDVEVSVQWKPVDGGRMVAFHRDITKRKQADEKIHQLYHLLLQSQENERSVISHELHESIAQNLSAMKINIDEIYNDPSLTSREAQEKLTVSSGLLSQAIKDIKNLAYDLRLPGLDEIGLVKALQIYCEEASENGNVKVDFQSIGMSAIDLPKKTKLHIYRLIQEALSNIRKHADADHATIILTGSSPNIILRIEDNGRGFDINAQALLSADSKRMGIHGMQERVNLLEGQMTIQSQPMKGTKILIKIPISGNTSGKPEKHKFHIDAAERQNGKAPDREIPPDKTICYRQD
jgi:PAS domain S-box-containing protein